MNWTRATPTDGWYWCRNVGDDTAVVLRILNGAAVMAHMNIQASVLHCEWAGPIPLPKEQP